MDIASLRISKVFVGFLLALTIALVGAPTPCSSSSIPYPVKLHGHVPTKALAAAKSLGGLASDTQILMTFVLPLRNQEEFQNLLKRIYDPTDLLYGHYLTPGEFTDRFGPTQEDYDALAVYAKSLGLTVTGTHPNRTLLDVSGPVGVTEAAFNLHLQQYQTQEGRKFHAPDNDPEVPDFIASRITGIIGLDNYNVRHAHKRFTSAAETALTSPDGSGSSPGGMTPGDILTAYNLQGVAPTGSGQTIALFELDGYHASDVAYYASYYGLPSIPLQNVLSDGFSGAVGIGADEVTLDIELLMALAPGVSKIIVYEGPNTDRGVLDTYNKIATDNLAKQVSTSWGLSEDQSSSTVINSENTIFRQMAAQGQSIYAASGDSGAYDNGSTLSVNDPASQPFMVGVGGTRLFVNADMTYNHESSWNDDNTVNGGAGGGGVSSLWSIPAWQQGVASAASSAMRNVPDVSLNADYLNSGYSIYYQGGWWTYGGTSCAAPLWAAFTARVNQQRAAGGNPPLGFANPAIYQIAAGARYGADFHDIADGSTNLYYTAVTGYDNATGWGSFNGVNLLADLAPTVAPGAPTIGTAKPGNAQAAVAFIAPASNGGSPITLYTAKSNPDGISATGTVSPITVPGLTNGTTYTFTVTATNSVGTSMPSSASNSITPAPPIIINNGSPYTQKTTVSLALTYLGAASMQFTTNGTTWTAWGAYAATRNLTLPTGDGLKTVSVRFRDSNLVISDIYSATIMLDTKAPVNGTLTPTQLAGNQIKLDWTAFSDATSGISSYKLVRGATLPAASCTAAAIATPAANETTYTETGSQGMNYFYRLCAVDNTGNISTGATTPAVMAIPEVNKPSGTVSINQSNYTSKAAVTLNLAASDDTNVAAYCISNTTTCTAWTKLTTPVTPLSISEKPWTLAAGADGNRTVNVWFKDVWGNVSAPASAAIILDTKAPVNGKLTPTQLAGNQIKLDWTGFSDATSGISTYKLVRGATLPAASCTAAAIATPAADETTYTDTGSQGMNYFYRLCAVDNAGNVSTGATTPAVMAIPEVNKPSGTVSITPQGNYTSKAAVTLNLAATDDTNVAAYCISNTTTCTTWTKLTTPVTPLSIPSKQWTLAAGADGNRTVNVWFKDVWGNVSAPASASTTLDKTLPVNGNLAIDSTFNLSWNGFSDATSGIASYVLVRGTTTYPACSTASAVIYSGDQTAFGDSSNTNSGTIYYYRLCAVDNAGNISTGATAIMKKP